MPNGRPIKYKDKVYRTESALKKAKKRAALAQTKKVGKSMAQKEAELSETIRKRTGSPQTISEHRKSARESFSRYKKEAMNSAKKYQGPKIVTGKLLV